MTSTGVVVTIAKISLIFFRCFSASSSGVPSVLIFKLFCTFFGKSLANESNSAFLVWLVSIEYPLIPTMVIGGVAITVPSVTSCFP